MKPQIDPVSSNAPRMVRKQIMNAEGCGRVTQERVDLLTEPPRVAQFDSPAVAPRGSAEEARKPIRRWLPVWWQLH
jgi:hypothetical protein